ncbi:G patch domain and ankyrin repeat-containing protein 1 [Dinochytrium kinnereticum]|nr:G patch domain and ankyrin repeat-containing protein 1 [Dinochytrium kinnereticum]
MTGNHVHGWGRDEDERRADLWEPYRLLTGSKPIDFRKPIECQKPGTQSLKGVEEDEEDSATFYRQSIREAEENKKLKKKKRATKRKSRSGPVRSETEELEALLSKIEEDMAEAEAVRLNHGGIMPLRQTVPLEPFWCEICGKNVEGVERAMHETGMNHLLAKAEAEGKPPQPVIKYSMSEKNVGYRLLQRQGWEHGKPLGPEDESINLTSSKRHFPILATLKQDRQGLGVASDDKRTKRVKVGDKEAADGVNPYVKAARMQKSAGGGDEGKAKTKKQREDEQRMEAQRRRALLAYMNG